jgi:DNA-binding NtrC family response regulator
MVMSGRFRQDLWFRLNVFPIWIPPLREREEDIPALLQHFINVKAQELKLAGIPSLLPDSIAPLMNYHWPGNVRELENVVERALILNPSGPLTSQHLNVAPSTESERLRAEDQEAWSLDEIASRHIRRVLSMTRGKINGPDGAAAILGINPSTLRHRMKKLGIGFGRKS